MADKYTPITKSRKDSEWQWFPDRRNLSPEEREYFEQPENYWRDLYTKLYPRQYEAKRRGENRWWTGTHLDPNLILDAATLPLTLGFAPVRGALSGFATSAYAGAAAVAQDMAKDWERREEKALEDYKILQQERRKAEAAGLGTEELDEKIKAKRQELDNAVKMRTRFERGERRAREQVSTAGETGQVAGFTPITESQNTGSGAKLVREGVAALDALSGDPAAAAAFIALGPMGAAIPGTGLFPTLGRAGAMGAGLSAEGIASRWLDPLESRHRSFTDDLANRKKELGEEMLWGTAMGGLMSLPWAYRISEAKLAEQAYREAYDAEMKAYLDRQASHVEKEAAKQESVAKERKRWKEEKKIYEEERAARDAEIAEYDEMANKAAKERAEWQKNKEAGESRGEDLRKRTNEFVGAKEGDTPPQIRMGAKDELVNSLNVDEAYLEMLEREKTSALTGKGYNRWKEANQTPQIAETQARVNAFNEARMKVRGAMERMENAVDEEEARRIFKEEVAPAVKEMKARYSGENGVVEIPKNVENILPDYYSKSLAEAGTFEEGGLTKAERRLLGLDNPVEDFLGALHGVRNGKPFGMEAGYGDRGAAYVKDAREKNLLRFGGEGLVETDRLLNKDLELLLQSRKARAEFLELADKRDYAPLVKFLDNGVNWDALNRLSAYSPEKFGNVPKRMEQFRTAMFSEGYSMPNSEAAQFPTISNARPEMPFVDMSPTDRLDYLGEHPVVSKEQAGVFNPQRFDAEGNPIWRQSTLAESATDKFRREWEAYLNWAKSIQPEPKMPTKKRPEPMGPFSKPEPEPYKPTPFMEEEPLYEPKTRAEIGLETAPSFSHPDPIRRTFKMAGSYANMLGYAASRNPDLFKEGVNAASGKPVFGTDNFREEYAADIENNVPGPVKSREQRIQEKLSGPMDNSAVASSREERIKRKMAGY